MVILSLPNSIQAFMELDWSQIEPFYQALIDEPLTPASLDDWMAAWSRLSELVDEYYSRLYVATTLDTGKEEVQKQYANYLDNIFPPFQVANQKLKEKLLASGLEPEGFSLQLRDMRMEAALYRDENLTLLSEELKFNAEYDQIVGAQSVEWEGQEITLPQLRVFQQDLERDVRERAWRLYSQRQLADRQAINALWQKLMAVRGQIAANAGFDSFRDFRWRQLLRHDYTPEDCKNFSLAIEEVVVPVAERFYDRQRRQLGLNTLRPWDLDVETSGQPPLRPFEKVADLEGKTALIFKKVDPKLGEYFETLRREGLLDLENRKGKAPGAYSILFASARRPFVFVNAVGTHADVQTLLHEGGHAFHEFEKAYLPYYQQLLIPNEFAEVASMGMELLAFPYMVEAEGGFYSERDSARARLQYLKTIIYFWPYMAVVDSFQHWVYENHQTASDPVNCDAKWAELWARFMRGVDWSGLDQEAMTGWHNKPHIHQLPFYYVEYGIAMLGAVQVWRNAGKDQHAAVQAYRKALSLGSTVTLPELFKTAGAKFALDADTLRAAVGYMEEMMESLEAKALGS